jgi:hypothetical protein
MGARLTPEVVERALAPFSSALEADGYILVTEVTPHHVVLRIVATAEACEDCLVPEGIFISIVTGALEEAGISTEDAKVHVIYPAHG